MFAELTSEVQEALEGEPGAVYAEGLTMTKDEAVAYALDEAP